MLSARQQHCLRGIGIRLWRDRATELPPVEPALASDAAQVDTDLPGIPQPQDTPDRAATAAQPLQVDQPPRGSGDEKPDLPPPVLDDWDGTIAAIHACTACELAQHCTQKVPGVGNLQAQLLIVGEGPGHDEDIRGEPFVGRSGQLLDRMLAAIGIAREAVYITNIVKCRPPNNRDPRLEEAQQCRAFLDAQIKLIRPRVILSVGRVSAHNLLDTRQPVGKLIQQMHQLPGTDIPVKVTYHPAYLLRNPAAKRVAWEDLKLLHRMLQ